jgi:hypothetical protein
MKYALLIYGNEAAAANATEAEQQAEMAGHYAFTNEVRERGVYDSGEALNWTKTATTVRLRDSKILTTDGPFAETHEQLGGYYILDCKDLDEAIEFASKIAKIPGTTGSVEIRPVMVFE